MFCLVVLFCGMVTSDCVQAAESGGGQVSSNSKITFYGGESKKEEPTPSPNPAPKPTPKPGILPQTGEVIKNYSVGGIAVLSVVAILFVRRRRRGKHEK